MKKRNLMSLLSVFAFLSISVSGVLLFFGIKSETIEIIHILFGFFFMIVIAHHIRYNIISLKKYIFNKKVNRIPKELSISLVVSFSLLLIMCSGTDFVFDLANSGKQLFKKTKKSERSGDGIVFKEIATNKEQTGCSLYCFVQEKESVIAPSIVIWVVDSCNQYVENLFLPSQKIRLPFFVETLKEIEKPEIKNAILYDKFDTSLMPEFSKYTPSNKTPNYNSYTPLNSFILKTNTKATGCFTVYMEIRDKETVEIYKGFVKRNNINNVFLFESSEKELVEIAFVRLL